MEGSLSEDEEAHHHHYSQYQNQQHQHLNNGRRCEWHPETVGCLLDSYADKCMTIKGYLKLKDWEDIVNMVNSHCQSSNSLPKTLKQCRDKVENLKRRYKLEKKKHFRNVDQNGEGGGNVSVNWSFFEKLDFIMSLPSAANSESGLAYANQNQNQNPLFETGFDFPEALLPVFDKGKILIDSDICNFDDILNNAATVGSSSSPEKCQSKHKRTFSCFSSKCSTNPNSSSNSNPSPSPSPSPNSVQSLADALVRFSEVYARVELAKTEIFTKLVIELSKLRTRKRRRKISSSPLSRERGL
eukprot:TRINITY_DN32997_c0_g1_i1.p1 TRINITY_DN32997_c0_g1~~TRINITY_DN32997_c0_g1_i1.p1  ORF type:complete len:299 (-),score=27.03 TRINITY_DN32997_c0_g1_i1:148-1044(-)